MRKTAAGLGRAWRALRWGGGLVRLSVAGAAGRGPRLPPGTLGPSALARFGDHRFYAQKLQRYGPIFKVLWDQNLTVCIVGFKRARRLLAAHGHALCPMTIDIRSFVPCGFMRSMAPEPHARYRNLFLSALRTDLTERWDADLRSLVRTELDRLASATRSARPDGAPALTPALDRIATRGLLMMFFGLRPAHPMFAALEAGYRRMGPSEFVHPIGPEQRAAFDSLRALAWDAVEAMRADPAWADDEGVLGRIAGSDRSAVDETVIGNLIYMVEMGRYDVRSLMRWVLKYLSDAPAVVADLRNSLDTPGNGDRTSLAEAVVLETLRLDQAEALNRAVTDDIVFDGWLIPKGSALRVLLRESHQDAATFSDPERFAPGRFTDQPFSSLAYAPFGIGEHRCIAGQMVVRLSTLLVEEIVGGFTWVVIGDGSRHRGRYHWEPAPGFELDLRSRAEAAV